MNRIPHIKPSTILNYLLLLLLRGFNVRWVTCMFHNFCQFWTILCHLAECMYFLLTPFSDVILSLGSVYVLFTPFFECSHLTSNSNVCQEGSSNCSQIWGSFFLTPIAEQNSVIFKVDKPCGLNNFKKWPRKLRWFYASWKNNSEYLYRLLSLACKEWSHNYIM